jgi:hypothetical protein
MEVHIGSIIKARSKSARIGPTELGTRIETSKQNVYGIFKRKSIDTELLARISAALDHDFFQYLSKSYRGGSDKVMELGKNGSKIESNGKSSATERENEYLRRLNALLEEKISTLEKQLQVRV